jgi:hypothetical protein
MQLVQRQAAKWCLGRVVAVMEGGYCCPPPPVPQALAPFGREEDITHCVRATVSAMAGVPWRQGR